MFAYKVWAAAKQFNFDQGRFAILLWLTPLMAALAILLGASVLLGWAANSLWITRLDDKFISMSPAAALCLILFGAVLLCRKWKPDKRVAQRIWRTLAMTLLLLNVATFIQTTFFNIPDLILNILQRITRDPSAGHDYAVGVMSPLTALLFVILSFAALLSPPERDVVHVRDHVAQSIAVFVLIVAHIIVIGYWYGAPLLYGGETVPVALTTAIGFILLSCGFLFEGASAWFFRWMTSDTVSSRLTRVILPGVIGVILINGWIQLTIFPRLPAGAQVLSSSLVAIFTATLISLLTVVVARQTQAAITRADYALRASEKRFKALIENATDVIVIIDAAGLIHFASPAAECLLGYMPEEAIGKNFLEWVHPADLSEVVQSLANRSKTPGTARSSLIVRGRHKDGSWRFIEAIGSNLLGEPSVQGIVLNMRDVTERKRAEEAIQNRTKALELLHRAGQQLSQSLEINNVFGTLRNLIAESMDCETLFVSQYNPIEKMIHCRYACQNGVRLDADAFPPLPLAPEGYGTQSIAIQTGKSLLLNDYLNQCNSEKPSYVRDGSQITRNDPELGDPAARSALVIPIWFVDGVRGVLQIFSYRPNAYTQENCRLAEALASQVTGVFANALLFEAVNNELAERKRAEVALRAAEEKYRSIFENASEGIYQSTPDGRFLTVNPALACMLGFGSPQEMIAEVTDIAHQVYVDASIRAEFMQAIAVQGNVTASEYQMRRKNSETIWTSENARAVRDAGGAILYYEGVIEDITKRKRAEEALRLSETMLKASQRVAHVGHYVFSVQQRSWSSSEALDGIFGIDGSYPRTVEGWFALIDPDYGTQMLAYLMDHVLRDHHPFDKEYPVRRANDGMLRWVHVTGELEFDDSGQPLKMFGTVQDITPYKDTEEKLRRRALQLAIINDISTHVTRATSVAEVLRRAAQLVQSNFHYHYVGLFIYDTQCGELVLRAKAGDFTHIFPLDYRLQPDHGMVGWVCRARQTLLANDVHAESHSVEPLGDLFPTRSELSVPIQSGGTLLGVIDVQSAMPHAFEANDVLLIETLAQQIAAAIENARLHESAFNELAERERREREMDAVIRMGIALRDVASRTDLAEAVLPALCELLGVEHVLFGVADLLTDERVVIGTCGNWTPLQGQRSTTSLARQVAPDGIPHLVEDEDRSKFASPELFEGLVGVVVTPLLINEEQLGSLWIGSAHLISEDTLRLFALLSGLVANVVQRVNSVERTEQHMRRLTALHEIDLAISYSLDLEQTLSVLLHQVCDQLQVDAADVLLYNSQAQTLRYAAGNGFRTTALQYSTLDIGEGLAGRAALEKTIVASLDIRQIPSFQRAPLLAQESFMSYYGVPLLARGEVVGVLEIFHRTPLQPNPEWLRFLEALASQAAIAIDNASLFTQLQSSIKSLYETQEQLIRTARLSAVGELAAGIAHQINNPLTTVISDSQVLMRLTPGEDPLHISAKAIYQAGWRAQRVVQRLLNFARPDEDQYTESNVNETIMEALDLIGAHLGRGGVDLQLRLASDMPLISANLHQLEEVWLNLLMNARDALSEERKGRIEVTSCLTANGDALEVLISDNGRGIRESDRANLFTPFFTTKGNNRGNGLGLSVCQSIVQHHGGEITFTSAEDVGTTFVVRLPLSRVPSL